MLGSWQHSQEAKGSTRRLCGHWQCPRHPRHWPHSASLARAPMALTSVCVRSSSLSPRPHPSCEGACESVPGGTSWALEGCYKQCRALKDFHRCAHSMSVSPRADPVWPAFLLIICPSKRPEQPLPVLPDFKFPPFGEKPSSVSRQFYRSMTHAGFRLTVMAPWRWLSDCVWNVN